MKKILVLLLALVLILLIIGRSDSDRRVVSLGERELLLWVAENTKERTRGLSGVESLDDVDGMLFIFNKEGIHSFWMKDMNFSIDIIWINKEGEVIGFTENIAPETYPQTFKPEEPIMYVIEVSAGWVEENLLEVGEKLVLNYE